MKSFSFYVVTDTHYFSPRLGAEGSAYDEYMKREQCFMRESSEIIRAVFEKIAEDEETSLVLMPGDLSKDGELASNMDFSDELEKLRKKGKSIFVITAGHDYNDYSHEYKDDKCLQAEGTEFNALYDIYYMFGYSDAISMDMPTNSYIADISEGVRLLAINCDSPNGPKGAVDERLMGWIKVQLEEAAADGCFVIAMCHYPAMPCAPVFSLVGDAQLKNWSEVSSFLADNGVRLILTGHMHIQSINRFTDEKGNSLVDICTSSAMGSPAKYRKITVEENGRVKVESIAVEGFDTCGVPYEEFFDKQFSQAILNRVLGALNGGEGAIKFIKALAGKIISNITLGTLGRLVFIRVPKSLKKKKLTEMISLVGLAIFKGDRPFCEGTDEYTVIERALKRFGFIIRKIEPKLSKNNSRINLTEMILNSIGKKELLDNNETFSII